MCCPEKKSFLKARNSCGRSHGQQQFIFKQLVNEFYPSTDVNRNIVYPTLFYNPHLDDEENNKNGVEIVELRSDEDSTENEQENDHSWCNIERHEEYEDLNEANKISRDKRREINEKSNCENLNGSKYRDEEALNQFVSDFYGLDCYDTGERISTLNPHSQFFTINNNHKTPDTSSESNQYDDIEVIQCENTKEMDYLNDSHSYNDRTFTYDNDGNAEKRTIWMYALKNNRYLSEHDFGLINIPSRDSNSTTDDEDTSNDAPYIRRIATPIPRYIPKMNFSLSPSLPTVTEVSESNKQATNNSDVSINNAYADKHSPLQKHSRGWCENKTTETQTDNYYNQTAENKNIKYENENLKTSKKEQQTQTYCEPTLVIRDAETSPTLNIASFKREVDNIEINEDDVKTTNKELSSENKIDRSSHEPLCNLQKRHIRPTPHETLKKDITDPLEKLDGNWIGETLPKDDEFLEVFDYHDEKCNEVLNEDSIHNEKAGGGFEDCVSDMKPAEWTYLPLGDSVPSLHLSISVDTDCGVKRKSWFKRFLHFFHCCT